MKCFPYILFSLFLLPIVVAGQTNPTPEQNYVLQKSYQNQYTQSQLEDPNFIVPDDSMIENIMYYDGLGRPKQSVSIRAGGNREDLITPVIYDAFGRQPKEYLPLPSPGSQGAFRENIGSWGVVRNLVGYYENKFPNDSYQGLLPDVEINPYSEKRFESSPLNRVLEQAAPGNDWRLHPNNSGHTIKFDQGSNNSYEVRDFYVTYPVNSNEPELQLRSGNNGNYMANTVFKNITKDENWTSSDGTVGTTSEFRNKLGQVVLKRVRSLDPVLPVNGEDRSLNHDTYYVYDDYGNLVFVLSPEGSRKIIVNNAFSPNKKTILEDLCYQYKYDSRNRLVWKKVPGKGYETILYNDLDLPVLTQDANMREDNPGKYLFTKYDALGRVAYTGFYTSSFPRQSTEDLIQNRLPASISEVQRTKAQGPLQIGDTQVFYSNSSFPSDNLEVLTINYYDKYVDYTVPRNNGLSLPTTVLEQPTTQHTSVGTTTQGLPTVSKVRVLGSSMWITSLTAYDSRGRAIYSDSYNEYLGSRDILRSKLELISGRPSETRSTHIKNSKTIIVVDYFTYDHMGRLLSQQQQIDNTPVQLIAKNSYDALGQLERKQVGGETAVDGYTDIEEIDVTYDGLVTPIPSTGSWPSRLKTRGKIMEDGGISFKVEGLNKFTRVGLVKPNNGITANQYLDYGIYLRFVDNAYKVYIVNNGADQSTGRTYTPGDTFKVKREGNYIKYYHNSGAPFTSVTYVGNGEALTGKVAFSGPGGGLSQLGLYGPNIDKVLQNVLYKYNIRGWLTDINNVEMGNIQPKIRPLFNFRINYNKVEGNARAQSLYNGNISQTLWKTLNEDKDIRSYGYSYDRLNRITGADSYRGTNMETMEATSRYDVQGISYDLNGNILSLIRFGADDGTVPDFGQWDDLKYSYNGNQLRKVVDASESSTHRDFGFKDGTNTSNDYLYDDNGNMKNDKNKGILTISYNHLNLPMVIDFGANRKITYIYDATGVKLEKLVKTESRIKTQYAGRFIYNDAVDGQMKLQFFSQPEGYVEPVSGTNKLVKGFDLVDSIEILSAYRYVFQYRDHLGDIRLSYSDLDLNGAIDPNTEIIEEKNYYPFGLEHKGYNNVVNGVENPYKYQGKEHEEELGLNTYDFGWRNFDPAIARWMVIDPLAERRYDLTPYNFVQNSPMFRIDPDGLTDFTLNKKTGEVAQVGDANDDPDRILKTDSDGNVKKKGEGLFGFLTKKSERGKAKVAVGGIEQGILQDGQNLKTEGNAFEVGGEGQPTEAGVEAFALKLSDYVGTEIGGAYFSLGGGENTTHITIGGYENNSFKETKSNGMGAFRQFAGTVEEFTSSITGFFHTHPSGSGISDSDRLVPSGQDRRSRDNSLNINPSLKFFLLTNPNYGGKYPRKIPYTKGYPASDRR